MKINLMMMTAMLCFCVTHTSQAQDPQPKNEGEVCEKAEDCKSNVCTDKKCAPVSVVDQTVVSEQGKKTKGEKVEWVANECESGKMEPVKNTYKYCREECEDLTESCIDRCTDEVSHNVCM